MFLVIDKYVTTNLTTSVPTTPASSTKTVLINTTTKEFTSASLRPETTQAKTTHIPVETTASATGSFFFFNNVMKSQSFTIMNAFVVFDVYLFC